MKYHMKFFIALHSRKSLDSFRNFNCRFSHEIFFFKKKITLSNYWKRFFSKSNKYEYQLFVQFVYLNRFLPREFSVRDEDEELIGINHLNKLVNIVELTNLNRKMHFFFLLFILFRHTWDLVFIRRITKKPNFIIN
jgi:hypothetical protein